MSTLRVEELAAGDGKTFPAEGDTVWAYYRGTLAATGEEFDSNFDKDEPLKFVIGQGQVIEGWETGFQDVSEGATAKLSIPAARAYAEHGYPDGEGGYAIPPNSDLIFEVKLVRVEKHKKKKAKPTMRTTTEDLAMWRAALTVAESGSSSLSSKPRDEMDAEEDVGAAKGGKHKKKPHKKKPKNKSKNKKKR